MKLVSIFVALFILGLMTIPCSDALASADDAATEIAYSDIDESANFDGDFCSPFCSCHCCHTHLISDIKKLNEPILFPYDVYKAYYDRVIIEPAFPIFQPPKT